MSLKARCARVKGSRGQGSGQGWDQMCESIMQQNKLLLWSECGIWLGLSHVHLSPWHLIWSRKSNRLPMSWWHSKGPSLEDTECVCMSCKSMCLYASLELLNMSDAYYKKLNTQNRQHGSCTRNSRSRGQRIWYAMCGYYTHTHTQIVHWLVWCETGGF